MLTKTITKYSRYLGRDMNMVVYGKSTGVPFLGFPTQNSMCRNYEDFGLIREIQSFIEDGSIQVYTVDSVDLQSWSDSNGNGEERARIQEAYFNYIVKEVVPYIRMANKSRVRPIAMGTSMGANHAVISFLRRPDLFSGTMALSGVYNTSYFFGSYMDSVLYQSTPELFLKNMGKDHKYIKLYNQKKMILCCGQGAWEEEGVASLRNLESIFREKGIEAWCDFWGYDVNHDWPWWYKQANYFIPILLKEVKR